MNRRAFLRALSGGVLTAPIAAEALSTLLAGCANVTAGHFAEALVPKLWFSPDTGSTDMLDLFTNVADWENARKKITVFGFFGNHLYDWARHGYPNPPAEIGANTLPNFIARSALTLLTRWGIKIAIEWPPTWNGDSPGQSLAALLDILGNVVESGNETAYVNFDSTLEQGTIYKGWSQAQTVNYLKDYTDRVLAQYPNIIFGDIACINTFTAAQILSWLDACAAARVPLAWFTLDPLYANGETFWTQATALASGLTERSIPFHLIINPGIPAAYVAADAAYYSASYSNAQTVLSTLTTVEMLHLESWYSRGSGGPKTVPNNLTETTANSHTKLVLDVATLYSVPDITVPTHPPLRRLGTGVDGVRA